METITNFLTEYYDIILMIIGAIEVFARIKPTDKNYSILDFIYKLLSGFAPNLSKNNQKFTIAKVKKQPRDNNNGHGDLALA